MFLCGCQRYAVSHGLMVHLLMHLRLEQKEQSAAQLLSQGDVENCLYTKGLSSASLVASRCSPNLSLWQGAALLCRAKKAKGPKGQIHPELYIKDYGPEQCVARRGRRRNVARSPNLSDIRRPHHDRTWRTCLYS